MAKLTDLVLDAYERRARLTPGLFAIAPVVVLVLSLGLEKNPLVSGVIGVVTAGGGAYLLSVVVANLGRRLQNGLWESWGGTPTAQLLRAHSDVSNVDQRLIWRSAIQNITGVVLLTEANELSDPIRADEVIAAAVGQVRNLTHDDRYPLIAKENAQYGLERNLYGSRCLGRGLTLTCLAGILIALVCFHTSSPTLVIGIVVEVVLSVLWFIIPSGARMKDAAFRYGEQLLQAVTHASAIRTSEGGNRA
jgi:hypothetical protein